VDRDAIRANSSGLPIVFGNHKTMNTDQNPYAPPTAPLELREQCGEVFSEGKLVRIDRSGRLPHRCVLCNGPGYGKRLDRRSVCSPRSWRLTAIGILAAIFAAIHMTPFGALRELFVSWVFMPLVLIVLVVHFFVRERVRFDYALCKTHWRLHMRLFAVSVTALLTVIVLLIDLISTGNSYPAAAMPIMVWIMMLLELGRKYLGPLRVRASKTSPRHIWLRGTGSTFRESFPPA
jgi:hypothetical protein